MADENRLDEIDAGKYLHFADVLHVADKSVADIESDHDEFTDSFDAMNLKPDLLRGVYAYGFERPSTFQQHAIMPIIKGGYKSKLQSHARFDTVIANMSDLSSLFKGNDVIAQARSGSGKTSAFAISILQKIDPDIKACQAIILAPTRQRAQQIQRVITAIGDFTNIECYGCFGGTAVQDDIKALQDNLHPVVVGTPGRIHDMIQRRALRTDNIKMFALDEADDMLSRGFTEQIHDIFRILSQSTSTQVALFSATMPQDVLELITEFMRDPVRIRVKTHGLYLRGSKQFYLTVENEREDWKVDNLSKLHETILNRQVVIFCNLRKTVEWLTDKLTARDFAFLAMHGDMPAYERADIMSEFRSGSRVLIATDMLARGINLQEVPLVINYDLPAKPENYIHRVGHGGGSRLGPKVVTINFVTADEMHTMHEIEQFYSTQIEKMPTNIAGKAHLPSPRCWHRIH